MVELWRRAIVQSGIRPGGWRAPLMHALLFWGATGLVAATLLERAAHAGLPRPECVLALDPWLPLAREASGAALAFGAGMAVYRRFIRRWQRLELDLPGDRLALGLLLAAPVSGFLVEGARLALVPAGAQPELWLGRAVAHLIARLGFDGATTYGALRIAHAAAALALFAAIPFTRLRHVLAAPLSILLTARAPAALVAIGESGRLPWRLRLQLAACSGCARCDEACPPALAGRPLSPMRLLLAQRVDPAARGIPVDALEACTGCGACEERCPIGIAHRIRIEALRRAAGRGAVGA
jgi:ferredoxin